MTHGYYAAMGGFAFDTHNEVDNFLPGSCKRLTLTFAGIQLMAKMNRLHLLPDISKDQIEDKSKASGLAKLLICLQAGWFCVGCLVRWIRGLAISLLELNALAHSIMTLVVYVLWWDKPLDVDEPSLMRG